MCFAVFISIFDCIIVQLEGRMKRKAIPEESERQEEVPIKSIRLESALLSLFVEWPSAQAAFSTRSREKTLK
jgi:hypothetical protein